MPSKSCTVCGNEVEIPAKINGGNLAKVKCPSCGATASLWVRRRNGNVKGLKGCFAGCNDFFNIIKGRRIKSR